MESNFLSDENAYLPNALTVTSLALICQPEGPPDKRQGTPKPEAAIATAAAKTRLVPHCGPQKQSAPLAVFALGQDRHNPTAVFQCLVHWAFVCDF